MNDIAVYGAGGLGRETALLIRQIIQAGKNFNLVGFYDDSVPRNKIVDGLPVLGTVSDLNQSKAAINVALAVSDPDVRNSIVRKIINPQIQYPVLVHPTCLSGQYNEIGRGCILTAGVILTTGVRLEEFVIVNLASTIGHDVTIGAYTSVMPGVNISGNVRIGSHSLLGTGSKILQNLSIGNHCKIGAGAVVTREFGNAKTIIGIPANEK